MLDPIGHYLLRRRTFKDPQVIGAGAFRPNITDRL